MLTGTQLKLSSPNGNLAVTFDVGEIDGVNDTAFYELAWRGRTIISKSRLCLYLKNAPPLGEGLEIIDAVTSSADETWRPVYGERSLIRDNYRQAVVRLKEKKEPHRRLDITFRMYDAGMAIRYTLLNEPVGIGKNICIIREETEFRFLADHTTWTTYTAQGEYSQVRISQVRAGCERPLTIRIDGGPYISIAEAYTADYSRMKLRPGTKAPCTLVSDLSGEVCGSLPLATPWRVVMAADTPCGLLENNDILLNLNAPCEIEDTAWIKPGKVLRDMTLTTSGGKACVDFASKHGISYVEFDAGWYGDENSDASDATRVCVDPKRSIGPLDLHEVIRYAEAKGIGIILYVNRRALEKKLDEILPLYRSWGIKGIKFGFVQVGSQKWTSWLHEAVRKAAEHRLMVDIHDEYRPTGYSRTYPNLMTQEGIRGDEERQPAANTLTILFSRMLAGAADNTVCYYDQRVDEFWSHAYQLAKSVVLYSPWQFLYWYDVPEASAPFRKNEGLQIIGNEPELEFFDHLRAVWDETRILHGEIGNFASVARRSGRKWFIGTMNAEKIRTLEIPLGFLDAGKRYTARIYSDDVNIQTRTKVRIDSSIVDASTVLRCELAPHCGQAVRLIPDDVI